MENKKNHKPLFTTFKRENLKLSTSLLIRAGALIGSLLIAMIVASIIVGKDIGTLLSDLIKGTTQQPWRLALDTFILLGFGISIVPVFKMKYWNMGANGQVLMGALVAAVIMFKNPELGMKSNSLLLVIMLISSIVVSIVWAVIPAIFKVIFNTNETLFTLMMNYIASTIVIAVNYALANGKKESPGIINQGYKIGKTGHPGWLPTIVDKYFLPCLFILIITVIIYFYINKTKHGYEVTVLGDSFNTAKYVGMKTGKIIIRTLILSGAITGVIGFLYVAAINHSLSGTTGGSLGFTGVLVAWLSSFNPITMAGVSLLLSFLTLGTSNITSKYRLGSNNLSNIVIGIIFFAILISEFFIRYRLKINIDFKKIWNNIKNFFNRIFKKKESVNKEGK